MVSPKNGVMSIRGMLVKVLISVSLEDIYLLIGQDNLKYMVTVSNQGQIHYIKKEEDFNAQNAGMMYNRIRSEGKRHGISVYQMSLTFLKRCNEVGLFYR